LPLVRSRLPLVSNWVVYSCLLAPAVGRTQASDDVNDSPLEEVIITAYMWQPERLQDLPTAASVINATQLSSVDAADISDLNRLDPSVDIKGTTNGRAPLGMRGVSTNSNQQVIGLTSDVSMEIDGVPVPPDAFSGNALDDVTQVEVLKGPQSTVGGRTASAGIINLVTASPTDTQQAIFKSTLTDDGEHRASLTASGPLLSSLSVSISGFDTHLPYLIHNDLRDESSDSDNVGGRIKLSLSVGADFDATLMQRYSRFSSRGANLVPQYLTPGAALFPLIPSAFDANGYPIAYGIPESEAWPGIDIRYGNTHYASPVNMRWSNTDRDTSLALNWRIGDYTVRSVTAWQNEGQRAVQDVFLSAVYFFNDLLADIGASAPPFNDSQRLSLGITQFSEELRVTSPSDRPVSFVAGAYLEDNPVTSDFLRSWVGFASAQHERVETRTYDLYERTTARLTPRTQLTLGVRYNYDELGWRQTQLYNPAAGDFEGCSTATGYDGPPTCTWQLSNRSSAVLGDVTLQQQLGTSSMAYLTLARDYKPPAFNTDHTFVSTQQNPNPSDLLVTQPVGQERIFHVELGFRGSALDQRIIGSVALFNTVYPGYQVETVDDSTPIGITRLVNARALTRGLETEVAWRPDVRTTISAAAAYIQALVTSLPDASCYPTQTSAEGCVGGVQNESGHPLPDSPRLKLNGEVDHRVPFQRVSAVFGGTLSYQTTTLLQFSGNPETRQPAFEILNLNAAIESKDNARSLTLFVNNVTNRFYLVDSEDFFSGSVGFSPTVGGNYVVGQPARDAHRYFGASVSVKL
jgi:iron complex outermembrane recepter protein